MVDLTFLTAKWEMPGAGVCNFHYLIKKAYLSRDINIFLSGRNLSLWCGHCQTFSSIMVNVCNHDFVNDQKCYLNGLLILTLCGSQVHNVLSYLSGLMNRFLLINPFKNHFKHFFFFPRNVYWVPGKCQTMRKLPERRSPLMKLTEQWRRKTVRPHLNYSLRSAMVGKIEGAFIPCRSRIEEEANVHGAKCLNSDLKCKSCPDRG